MKLLLMIVLAGGAGTLARYGAIKMVDHFAPGFPWGTLAVNVAGAFLAGFCFVLCRTRFQAYEMWFPVLFMGFMGAFTTFSTFALESARLLCDAQYMKFAANVTLQNVTGLLAALGGMWIGHRLFLPL